MNYEKKYEDALERASKLRVQNPFDTVSQMMEHVFPELSESEDEKIRRELIDYINRLTASPNYIDKYNTWIVWLEKQGEQKPANKVEPKFHEGDWVVNNQTLNTCLVKEVRDNEYCLWPLDAIIQGYLSIIDVENDYHLWSIQDAKNGDILVFDDIIMIFKNIKTNCTANTYILYCDGIAVDDWCDFGDDARPATKEQRDLLFQKMHEAGYEWDAEKKELKKIHVIDEGKAEMDYCFTKMMAGEKASPTWSEEDERLCQCLIRDQEEALDEVRNDKYGHSEIISDLKEMYRERIDWLKSLKDRHTWKPSEEQIDAIEVAIAYMTDESETPTTPKVLSELLEQLKKLIE